MTQATHTSVRPQEKPARFRFGCCTNMVASAADPVGAEVVEKLAELGFDYLDLSLRDLVALSSGARSELQRRLERAGISCEACNNFFPGDVRLTGPNSDLRRAIRYAEKALSVANSLGASVVVFGSSAARNVPAGFPSAAAWNQLRDLLVALGPIAQRLGVTVALEHLCRLESNILNTVAECERLAREVDHPHVRLLVDSYHLLRESEAPSILREVVARTAHVHIAESTDRVFPSGDDAFLVEFFRELCATPYAGRVSIEANTRAFDVDAARALRVCRELARSA